VSSVQKFSSGTGSPGWSRKKGRITVVCNRLLSPHQLCQKLLKSLVCGSYSKPKVGRFFETQCTYVAGLFFTSLLKQQLNV